ncbi:MAG: phage tail protein [Clostridiaceae bacterium]|nr:phage tail protein [Clostridiaceae bacterium]
MIGSFGPVIFSVSSLAVLTPTNISRNVSKRTTVHEVIKGKPRTEYLGPDLQTFSFDITLRAEYGVKPRMMLDLLSKMAEGNNAYLLQIGGRPIGEHDWCLDSVSEAWDTVYSMGELSQATVNLSLTEYVEDL